MADNECTSGFQTKAKAKAKANRSHCFTQLPGQILLGDRGIQIEKLFI